MGVSIPMYIPLGWCISERGLSSRLDLRSRVFILSSRPRVCLILSKIAPASTGGHNHVCSLLIQFLLSLGY